MTTVRSLRNLPQTFGLSGRRTRTPITEEYGKRGLFGMRNISPTLTSLQELSKPAGALNAARPGVDREGGEGVSPDASNDPLFTGALGREVTRLIMGNLAGKGLKNTTMTGATGLLAGAPPSAIEQMIVPSIMRNALSPIGFANTVGGGLLAGSLGEGAGDEVEAQGYSLSPSDVEAAKVAGAKGAHSSGGLISQGARGAASLIPGLNIMSPAELADEAASQSAAMSHVGNTAARGLENVNFGTDPQADFVGINADISDDSNVDASTAPSSIQNDWEGISADIDSDSGGGGTVLCSELYGQGIMPEDIYIKDSEFSDSLPREVVQGYRLWAVPLAGLMSRSRVVTQIMKCPVLKWAEHMAGDENWFGALAMKLGVPLCRMISRHLDRSRLALNHR